MQSGGLWDKGGLDLTLSRLKGSGFEIGEAWSLLSCRSTFSFKDMFTW